MDPQLHPADRGLRRISAVVLVLAMLAAAAAVLFARDWMIARALATTPELFIVQMRQWIGIIAVACGICLIALAAYAWRKAQRATIEKRWPLERARVLFDARVRRGEQLASIVRMLRLLAMLALVFAIGTLVLGWRLLVQIPA